MKTQPKGPFLGVNNRLPAFALHVDKVGDFLREASNVDVDNAGRLRRRKATALLQAMTAPHSLYMVSDTAGYLVRAASLYAITLPSYTETLVKVLASNARVSWQEFSGSLYYSNGTDSGRIDAGVWYPLGLPTPDAPTVTGIAGSLPKGKYRICVAYVNATTGEEGGVSAASAYSLTADGALRVTLPAATSGATHVNVYVSTANGSIPFLHSTLAAGTVSVDLTTAATGREANQRFEAPLPAGGQLFLHNGCLCSVSGASVFEGIPFRPGYYLPSEGRVPFPETVSNAVPAQNGVYVVADKTYWLPGSRLTVLDGPVVDVLPYGGVPGTAFAVRDDKKTVGWFGAEGIVLASITGDVAAVMADNIDQTAPASGVSAVFSSGGYRRVVSCGWCLNLENKAATSYSGYAFTSISGDYATASDGIHSLEATGLVAYVVDLGKEDFGAEQEKTMPAVYLGCASDGPMQMRVQAGDDEYTYTARSFSSTLDIHRVDPGKGLRANWFDLSLVGEEDFTLASISFAPIASNRRI